MYTTLISEVSSGAAAARTESVRKDLIRFDSETPATDIVMPKTVSVSEMIHLASLSWHIFDKLNDLVAPWSPSEWLCCDDSLLRSLLRVSGP